MGGCSSQPRRSSETKGIDTSLRLAQQEYASVIRLLLLGTGESGKSTIFKQVKIIHDTGYSEAERLDFVPIIHGNVVLNIQALIDACRPENLNLPFSDQLEVDAQAIKELIVQSNQLKIDLDIASRIDRLWFSREIQLAYQSRSQFYVGDSAQFFFDSLDRITASSYIPSNDDILNARVRTTGIIRRTFEGQGVKFEMIDVGGQRTDRRKWIHCFQDVQAVLFVASLCDYDQVLVEDGETNRMHEALDVFEDICQSRFFVESSIVLFLNKADLFQEKIKTSNITSAFADYAGPQEYGPASAYIKSVFESIARASGAGKRLYSHITCATNTENMTTVMSAVSDTMLNLNLRNSGFL